MRRIIAVRFEVTADDANEAMDTGDMVAGECHVQTGNLIYLGTRDEGVEEHPCFDDERATKIAPRYRI